LWPVLITGANFVERGWYNPLKALQVVKDIDWEGNGICASCASKCREGWEEKRRHIWEEIGKKLGVVDG